MTRKKKSKPQYKWVKKTPRTHVEKSNCCRALILGDSAKLRRELLRRYEFKKKALEKAKNQLSAISDKDEQAFRLWCSQSLGADISEVRQLQQQVHEKSMQLEMIADLAGFCCVTPRKLCRDLLAKTNPEQDFWMLLQARYDEKMKEYENVQWEDAISGEMDSDFDEMGEEIGDDNDEDGDEDFRDLDDLFEELFETIIPGYKKKHHTPQETAKQSELKKLYRELCQRYHPDKGNAFESKGKELWLSIQNAYQTDDLDRLRSIHSGLELEANPDKALPHSRILDMIDVLEADIASVNSVLRRAKYAPYWNFHTWPDRKKENILSGMRRDVVSDKKILEADLSRLSKQLDKLLNQPAKRNNPKKEKPEPQMYTPPLF